MGPIQDYPPAPEVQTLPHDAAVDEIVAALTSAGGCVIKNFVSLDVMESLGKEFGPLLNAEVDQWSGI